MARVLQTGLSLPVPQPLGGAKGPTTSPLGARPMHNTVGFPGQQAL